MSSLRYRPGVASRVMQLLLNPCPKCKKRVHVVLTEYTERVNREIFDQSFYISCYMCNVKTLKYKEEHVAIQDWNEVITQEHRGYGK